MRIGISCRFQNSYFSGSLPQVAVLLGRILQDLGHSVELLYPKGDLSWFIDCKAEADKAPPRREWNDSLRYDVFVEVTWFLPAAKRPVVANQVILFQHHTPLFHDMESSVYPFNPIHRDFTNLSAIWTWDLYGRQDIHYLEFLSRKPVHVIPFVWNFGAVDAYCKESDVPDWMTTASHIDARIKERDGVPPTMSWSARIVESNISNTSHCLVPVNIVSEIRRVAPIRFSVHNGEYVENNDFFKINIAKNLVLPDVSGNFVPRIRTPDLCREKSFIVGHQRFRPMKGYLLDALWAGIPVLHNCELLKQFGYFYELNQIRDAVECWKRMHVDYMQRTGFFAPAALEERRAKLRSAFRLERAHTAVASALASKVPPHIKITDLVETKTVENKMDELRIQFCDMWDQFNPTCNFFLSLFQWVGSHQGFKVSYSPQNPNVIVYGPFGDSYKNPEYAGIPKVFFTGENQPPRTDADTFLNLGFQYTPNPSYIRLPLWVLEINWFGADPVAVQNPRPVPLQACLKQDPTVLDKKSKFCGFVATNPRCQNRNLAFHILNEWRGVDAGGRLFCNLPGGPIPAGLGGGGGELAKVEWYKDYKYVIAFENESSPGYTTEKLFHAKVAGCVPIYWGDKFVDRDFDSNGFLNANTIATPDDLRGLIEKLEADPAAWRRMAEVPALTSYKRHWCERVMEEVARKVVWRVLQKEVRFEKSVWETAEQFHSGNKDAIAKEVNDDTTKNIPVGKRRIVSAANKRFVASAQLFVKSARQIEGPNTEIRVYVWPDVSAEERAKIAAFGAEIVELPTSTSMGWSDFWAPQHFAWKLWIHAEEAKRGDVGTQVLYLDAGMEIITSLDKLWNQTAKEDMCIIDDTEHPNERWCKPEFCEALRVSEAEKKGSQIWAGCIGFKVAGKYAGIHEEALVWAKKPEVICGEKWRSYSSVCKGHRHDQSILSILTLRNRVPRLPIRDVYCDRARRTAENWGTPLYVHRGNPTLLQPLIQGIDEAYVINLERRPDRLTKFKENPHLRDYTYVWKATDGRTMTLTPAMAALFRDNDFKWKKSVMGCAMSHFELWQRLFTDPIARSYLIMEDDVRFSADWAEKWRAAAPHILPDADVIYLGGVLPPNKAAFPSVVEPVNSHFARVAKNTLFTPTARRYFHFCNYSYVLTKSGATKLMQLIQQRGIFTSGDHMIVNHGDELLNIYFTTPLLTTCIQEDDPVYQKSDFNNFARLDTFDSDLWNNNDHFSQEELVPALAEQIKHIDIKVVKEPLNEEERKRLEEEYMQKMSSQSVKLPQQPQPQQPQQAQVASTTDKIAMWNQFLRAIALKKTTDSAPLLQQILAGWSNPAQVVADMAWFRIFEQLILTSNPEMLQHKPVITAFLQTQGQWKETVWSAVCKHWKITEPAGSNAILALDTSHVKSLQKTRIHYLQGLDVGNLYEYEWISDMFPHGVEWVACQTTGDILACATTPLVLHMNPHGGTDGDDSMRRIVQAFASVGRQFVLLHISDEVCKSSVDFYESPAIRHVFRNYWRAGLPNKVSFLPLGYAKGRSAKGLGPSPTFAERTHVWSFAGSLDRAGRSLILDQLKTLEPHKVATMAKWGDVPALQPTEYCEMLRNTKFVPCLRGFCSLESFRIYEALEHGCIPVYVPGDSYNCPDELQALYGSHPFLAIPSWAEAPSILTKLMGNPAVLEPYRQKVMDWWTHTKDQVRTKIAAALA